MTCKLITIDWWPETFSIQGIVLFYLQDFFPSKKKKKKRSFFSGHMPNVLFPKKSLRYNNEQSSMTKTGKNLEGCGALGAETKTKMITAACARKHSIIFFKQSLAVSFSVRMIQLLQNLYFDISSLKGAVLSISKLFCVHICTHSCMMHPITEERGRGGNKKHKTQKWARAHQTFLSRGL